MAKEVVISTGAVNCYGSRVLTSGIDLSQFERNPLLLWMHRRSFEEGAMPIGRIENLRIDGDRLIGTPVFDSEDEFAQKIARKWENGFLRMASAGLIIVETSDAPEHLLQGQRRATITRSRLEEVSIVDIGGNDEALQLYDAEGKVLKLASGEACDHLPLLQEKKDNKPAEGTAPEATVDNPKIKNSMNKELLTKPNIGCIQQLEQAQLHSLAQCLQLLGLGETATEQEVAETVRLLKGKAEEADTLRLAGITAMVDAAVREKRITADKKDHFINLGKTAGAESLRTTLEMMQPSQKPTDVLHLHDGKTGTDGGAPKTYAKLSEVPSGEIPEMKEKNPQEYARLYKAEYGMEI